jgi:hypothetical protein
MVAATIGASHEGEKILHEHAQMHGIGQAAVQDGKAEAATEIEDVVRQAMGGEPWQTPPPVWMMSTPSR